jgi:hypothetical protein
VIYERLRSIARISLLLIAWQGAPQSWATDLPEIELEVDPQLHGAEVDWRPWLEQVAASVAAVGDGFPVPRVKVVLHLNEGSEPVGFGWVRRDSPPEVHMRVSPEASLDGLLDDWHAYHEFAHLLLPFAGNRDIWFAEGLASYYQYFLQARAGVIDADEAWRRLTAGFQRGFDDPAGRGQRLSRLSPRMWRTQAFRRVYWTGAAFFLRVDHRLREASRNTQSLDTTLAAFADCCIDDGATTWTAESLIERLGALSLPEVWREEYERAIRTSARPEFGSAGHRLGLDVVDERLRLVDGPAQRAWRQAIALGQPVLMEVVREERLASP